MNYHKIEKYSVANGTGIRVVLWVSGCSLHCKGCQNPDTWNPDSGKLFDEDAKNELFTALDKSYITGITFSGGHPLEPYNIDEVVDLMKIIKEKYPDKDIWVYSGYTMSIIKKRKLDDVLKYADVIVDGRYIDELRDIRLKWRGSNNQRIWVNTDEGWIDATEDMG